MTDEKPKVNYQIVRGLPCPGPPVFKKENIEGIMDLVPYDGDLILGSFPKTGTTWMQYIILQIKSRGECFPSFNEVTFKIVPFLEMSGVESLKAQKEPRFYKHHLPYDFVKKNDNSKYVYVYRHPEDTVISFYCFTKQVEPDMTDDFETFFDKFVTGRVPYGNYFKHVLSFYERREDHNLLLVPYEELHAHRKEGILRIAKFIGEEYYQDLTENPDILEKIIEQTSFDYMKKNLPLVHPGAKKAGETGEGEERKKINFFRKGIVGDGKAALTDAQRDRIRKGAEEVLKGTSVFEKWYPE